MNPENLKQILECFDHATGEAKEAFIIYLVADLLNHIILVAAVLSVVFYISKRIFIYLGRPNSTWSIYTMVREKLGMPKTHRCYDWEVRETEAKLNQYFSSHV